MADWVGLLPVLAFVLTAGIPISVALAAHLFYHSGARPFSRALQVSLLEAGLFYVLGVSVLWSVGIGRSRAVTLLVVGVLSAAVMVAVPLLVGRRIVAHATAADPGTALRYVTSGWPLALLVVFAIFVLPGGAHRITFFHMAGMETCLLGFCGVSVRSLATVLLATVVAFFGPGAFGLIYASSRR